MRNIKRKILELAPYIIVKERLNDERNIGSEMGAPPDLYNKKGEKMKVFFLRDSGCMHTPYTLSAGRYPNRILWDRYNISLNTHFYVHEKIFEKTFNCENKVAVLRESEEIIPELYDKTIINADVMKKYSHIFTHSERVLNKYENAVFVPACSVWYGTDSYGGNMTPDNIDNKTKNISIIASAKEMCELHKVRGEIARYYKKDSRVDAFGTAVNNYIPKKADALEKYRYSIVLENSITPFYFTEKILDCFAAMTVPIYLGASKIGDYFNTDGIVQLKRDDLNDLTNLDNLINKCCQQDYNDRREAIIDNYYRVQKYLSFEDFVFDMFPQFS
ncbi:glycosyltransferase family 10 domain-containing protein [Butyrivibrio sp. YAB3001]|uniref:glycosyltransferase family 10 domain-containing protein n=1 Tax=Butyrivibrio sp. YAB3001 TaxID=1520812 RepID=UPI0008F68CFF|nr:glycosyltransferase family 10 [Butyrivibrio sp. YAB3001]SFC74555.1 Glycosyltransferase family 10 (fucosyltransferase) C-term [Butyrivibrio sp. YAB3001]